MRPWIPIALAALACSNTPSSSDAGAPNGGIVFAASGEALALTGYSFPPVNAGDPAFVDGWSVKFDRVIVTVDKVTLSNNPDKNPGDPSQTDAVVAEVDGPWAIDLAHADPSYLPGKGGGGEEAVPFASLANQNKNGNRAFATDGTRYAFGFDLVAATTNAIAVNLDAAAVTEYGAMVNEGCVVSYVGTATFKGDASVRRESDLRDVAEANSFCALLQIADDVFELSKPGQRSRDAARERRASTRDRVPRESGGHRASHGAHRSSVLGQRAPRFARALRSIRGARGGPDRRSHRDARR